MPNVFKVSTSLAALLDLTGDETHADLLTLMHDARLGPTVRELQALATVYVGMCSCWECVEL